MTNKVRLDLDNNSWQMTTDLFFFKSAFDGFLLLLSPCSNFSNKSSTASSSSFIFILKKLMIFNQVTKINNGFFHGLSDSEYICSNN